MCNNKKHVKTGSRLKKMKSADKYYQLAKPGKFLFIIKFY